MNLKPVTEYLLGNTYYSQSAETKKFIKLEYQGKGIKESIAKYAYLYAFKIQGETPEEFKNDKCVVDGIMYFGNPFGYVYEEDCWIPPKNFIPNSPNTPGEGYGNSFNEYTPLAY